MYSQYRQPVKFIPRYSSCSSLYVAAHIAAAPYCSTPWLLQRHTGAPLTATVPYCSITWLLQCHIAAFPDCCSVILQHLLTAAVSYCHTSWLLQCHIAAPHDCCSAILLHGLTAAVQYSRTTSTFQHLHQCLPHRKLDFKAHVDLFSLVFTSFQTPVSSAVQYGNTLQWLVWGWMKLCVGRRVSVVQ